MKKKQSKYKLLLWILLPVLLVAIIAAIVFIALPSEEKEKTTTYESKLYWNVERARYVSQGYYGVSSRIPDSDGYYRVNMAVDGEQIQVLVSDVNLINRMDFEEVMGLTFNENGVVSGILYLDEFTGGIAADKYVVVSVNGNTVVCNTSAKYKGIDVTFELSETTNIWQIGNFEPMVGLPTAIAEGDQVLMIRDKEGNISDVYVFPYVPPGDVYWNITRMFDTEGQVSTRERDSLGYFVYEFAINGEIKTLRTRDQDVANLIDKHASQAMGFIFDDRGDIIEVLNAGNVVCGGGLLCNRYIVTELNDDEVTFKLNTTVHNAVISKDCKFFDVSDNADYIGQPVDGIRLGDRVTVLKDRKDQVCTVFITNRITDDDIYWVVERNDVWNRTTGTTNRKPASDGWYYIKLAGNGKQITVKCKDAELVNKLDSYVCWCVKLDGDEIVGIQDATSRYGGSLFGAFNKLLSIDGDKLTIQKTSSTATATMAEDCLVYNVSSAAVTVGEPTNIRTGDTIYGFTDLDGVVRYIFVTSTTYNGRIYWNVTRQYDDTNKVTTRQRGSDGFYHFEMVVDGKVVWLKTASKEIATKVDMAKTRARALKLSGNIILDVMAPDKLTNYPGVKPDISWKPVTQVDGNSITVNNSGTEYTFKLASGCKIYNVTSAYESHLGETTTIQPGDYIVTLSNSRKQAVIVYVCGGRKMTFNANQETCSCNSDAYWQPLKQGYPLSSGYYYLTEDIQAPEGGWKLNGESVHLRLNGHKITSNGRAFSVASGSKLVICDHDTRGALIGTGTVNESGGLIQISGSTAVVNLYNIDINAENLTSDNGGAISVSGWLSLYDVNVSGGSATKKGGNICVMPTGNFRMFGGSIDKGAAVTDGANIYISGNTYMEFAKISGGISASIEGKQFIINNSVITDGTYGVNLLAGKLTLSGYTKIADNQNNLHLGLNTSIMLDQLSESSMIKVDAASAGVFCENATEADYKCFESENPDMSVVFDSNALLFKANHSHCIGHNDNEIGFTKLTQAMFDNATDTSSPVSVKNNNFVLAAGSYYLTESISLKRMIIVNGQVNLCLNSMQIRASSTRVFAITGGTMNLTDCGKNGNIQGDTASTGATILVQGSKGGANGTPGTLNVYGGIITGGKANLGGNIAVTGGTLNLYGGKLIGGTANNFGGNVYVEKGQTANLYGGQVTSGTAAVGECLYADLETTITLNGVEILDSVYLNGTQLVVEAIPETFTTQINAAASGVLIQNVEEAVAAQFTTVSDKTLMYDPDAKTLSLEMAAVPGHSHCLCDQMPGHDCAVNSWIGLTQADIISGNYTTNASNYYFLTEDVDLTAAITVASGTQLNLCLNGKTVTAPAATRALVINGGIANITDCQDTGILVGASTKNGGTVYIQAAKGKPGQLNLYGGTIQGNKCPNGGAVYIFNGCMDVYGGVIRGAEVTNGAGAVFIAANQSMNIYGGQIIAGTAKTKADCILAVGGAKVTVGGNAQVDEIYLNDGVKLYLSEENPIVDTALIGVYMNTAGVFIDDVQSYIEGTFVCKNSGKVIYWDPEFKKLSVTDPIAVTDAEEEP